MQDAADQPGARKPALLVAVAVIVLMGLGWSPALAHGPCSCLEPVQTPAGQQVRITGGPGRGQAESTGWPAYRVVFNPDPEDAEAWGIMPDYLASAYRADAPTTTVLSRPRRQPTREGRFRVPADAPPGLYMVQIFDGGEGGAHSTWSYVHVTDWEDPEQGGVVGQRNAPAGTPTTGQDASANTSTTQQGGTEWPLLGAVALAGFAVGIAALGAALGVRRRARRGT
jgi:hypothetical protein